MTTPEQDLFYTNPEDVKAYEAAEVAAAAGGWETFVAYAETGDVIGSVAPLAIPTSPPLKWPTRSTSRPTKDSITATPQ